MKGLDIGCGACLLARDLVSQGADMSVMDISEAVIAKANEYGGITGFQGNAEKTDFEDDQFDFLIITDVIEHIVDFRSALREIRRIVKPGGKVVISTTDIYATKNFLIDFVFPLTKGFLKKILGKKPPRPSRGHIHLFSKKGIEKELNDTGFTITSSKSMHVKDVSRNKFIVNPVSSIIGLVSKSTLMDQIQYNLKNTK